MIKKVINDKGGLHGRLSAQMRLEAFTLNETEKFLDDQGVKLKRKQLVELYMAFGGVAKYLTSVPTGKSSAQIINELCFSPTGALFSEFPRLYKSLFESAEKHMLIVRALAKKRYGMDQADLFKATGLHYGGSATAVLQELEESGFIISLPTFGQQTKNKQFRLSDEYSLFYLTWIEEVKSNVLRNFDKDYWTKICKTPRFSTWSGYAFKNICLKHLMKIKEALGLGAVTTEESRWQYHPPKKNNETSAEIDLIINRADQCINLCEIKFCNDEFEITKSYMKDLERKKEIFQKITGTKKTIFLTIITPFGVKENEHYTGLVDQQLTVPKNVIKRVYFSFRSLIDRPVY